jgi:hypothetical protein
MNQENSVGAATRHFAIDGHFAAATPYGSGHINDSYRAIFHDGNRAVDYLVQRINHQSSHLQKSNRHDGEH